MNTLAQHPILLIGQGGMLARAWEQVLRDAELAYDCPDLDKLDITAPHQIEQWITPQTQWVINCAAWTDVDGAEDNETLAYAINATGPAMLAERCAACDALLVHYSTDYVFDGQAVEPYPVDAPINPQSAYGRTKAAGELAIREQAPAEHLIIRTSWLYAPWGKNFVLTMRRLLREKDQLKVVHDQVGRPTSAQHLAQNSLALLKQNARGTFHLTDEGACSWYELTVHIAQCLESTCQITACTTAEFPRPAPRPAYSVLDLSASETLIQPPTPWTQNVAAVLEEADRDEAQ